jgi:hypothetical protein
MRKQTASWISIGLLVLAMVASPAVGAVETPKTVPQWSRFELALTNPKRHADPYREVALDVTYTRPDGSEIQFWGFYDGGDVWRARFMPDALGRWRYAAKFSDGSTGAAGEFECVASDLPGQIAVHADNPQWFGWRGGDAALIRAFHVGDRFFAWNWDDPNDSRDGNKRTAFLDWMQQQGYNTLSVASHYLNRDVKGRGKGWDTPKLWPLDAPEYRRMEQILDELAARRIVVYPFAGFLGRASNYPRDAAEQTLYYRYTIARLGASWNLLFNVAGPEPMLRHDPFLTADEINAAGAEIARLDPFHHPLSVHNPNDDLFKDSAWSTYGTLQGPKTFDRRKLRDGLLRNHHPQKPLLAQETLWSRNSIHMKANNGLDYSDDDLRKNAYVIHFCAAALVFADNDGDSSTGFSGSMDLADRQQGRHNIVKLVWDTVAGLPWQSTRPSPELITNTRGGAAFCLADPGRIYLVYFESAGAIDLELAEGAYRVEWINASNPQDRRLGGVIRDGGNLATPKGGDDWILQLTTENSETAALGITRKQ